MNKKELLEQKEIKTRDFESIVDVAETSKRELNEDEVVKIDEIKEEIRGFDVELDALESADVAKRDAEELEAKERAEGEAKLVAERDAKDKELKSELEATRSELADLKQNKRKNEMKENKLFESFRENLSSQTGGKIIAERAAVDGDTTAMGAAIPNYVEALDILGYEPIWKQMGADVLSGAKGTFTLPYEDPIVGAKLAQLASATGDIITPTGILVQPNRFTVQKTFTLETLNSATDEFLQAVLGDMVKGCDRAITKELYTKALAAASAVAAGAITKVGFDALMGGAEVEMDGAFLANRSSFFEAKAVAIDAGSGRFLVERAGSNGKGMVYDGTDFWYSNLFDDGTDQQYIVYGDTSKVFVADYGTVEIIIDKYTLAGEGQVVITVNKIANVAIKNPAAFVKSPDLDV